MTPKLPEGELLSILENRLASTQLVRINGRIVQVVGLVAESQGPDVRVGDLCSIRYRNSSSALSAEVVGFRGDRVLLMPLGDLKEIGPGCDERDQISVVLRAAGESLSVMAMAGTNAAIEEILAVPADGAGAVTLADAEACRAHGAAFAARLAPRLGEALAWSVRERPVSLEFVFPFAGEVRVVSRWFAGGKSCDLLLQFGRKAGAEH